MLSAVAGEAKQVGNALLNGAGSSAHDNARGLFPGVSVIKCLRLLEE